MPNIATNSPTAAGEYRLDRLVERSQRRVVQFPPGFYRDDTHKLPPLARMLRGGRGGEVRLKLYMSMTLLAASSPHDIKGFSGRAWASALALPTPEVGGARRVADSLNWLEEAKLINLRRNPGMPPDVTLLHPSGNGESYAWRGSWWINIPVSFWTNRWIYELSAPAVALLFATRDMRSNRKEEQPHPWLSGNDRKRYGLSDETWTRGGAELTRLGLLTIARTPQGRDFDYQRMRNTYWLHMERLEDPIPSPATGGNSGSPG
ncbi:hypothetical protein [Actinoplanes siamensis]|uniref:Uncharacterized protein n=1 Tax=Actinoplanes siamensis TaxID=1223317 RepID=A0A919TM98_9ACTN|nr:hypothetical protein [Actinoplanes siamensis]GIF08091.1 hypothetical protein Asi03nite_56290 [Actinoplanes siamensis]